ncbi:MAG: YggS family pyridoxal phosphate-dependent enzyme, partial [Proteobacteria bacterium]|nr:YggS family pyridoxal phosphate-dependent enzyme [Pseudomonadota bacterium]
TREKIHTATLRAGRSGEPLLIAVSKFQPLEKLLALYDEGQRDFGENYVQELCAKAEAFRDRGIRDVRFHFIGKLQRNKVKALLPEAAVIHSVDSIKLLREIEKRALEFALRPEVYFQINIDREATKSGFVEEDLPALREAVGELKCAVPAGLMAIPDPSRNPEEAFERMAQLSGEYGAVLGKGLSMGMSGDFERAIAHGSTVIRIGTALFGERPSQP